MYHIVRVTDTSRTLCSEDATKVNFLLGRIEESDLTDQGMCPVCAEAWRKHPAEVLNYKPPIPKEARPKRIRTIEFPNRYFDRHESYNTGRNT